MITEKIVYITSDNKQFDSVEKAERYLADKLGEFMDRVPILLSPGQRIKLNDFMVQNRLTLRNLLDF